MSSSGSLQERQISLALQCACPVGNMLCLHTVMSFHSWGGKERRGCREERRGREDREVALGEEGVGKKFLVIEISSGDGLVQ